MPSSERETSTMSKNEVTRRLVILEWNIGTSSFYFLSTFCPLILRSFWFFIRQRRGFSFYVSFWDWYCPFMRDNICTYRKDSWNYFTGYIGCIPLHTYKSGVLHSWQTSRPGVNCSSAVIHDEWTVQVRGICMSDENKTRRPYAPRMSPHQTYEEIN